MVFNPAELTSAPACCHGVLQVSIPEGLDFGYCQADDVSKRVFYVKNTGEVRGVMSSCFLQHRPWLARQNVPTAPYPACRFKIDSLKTFSACPISIWTQPLTAVYFGIGPRPFFVGNPSAIRHVTIRRGSGSRRIIRCDLFAATGQCVSVRQPGSSDGGAGGECHQAKSIA